MNGQDHQSLVEGQFGPRAEAYVGSAVHAGGADLDMLAELAGRLKPHLALDMGCGGGHVSYRLAPHAGKVTAYDLSAEMLKAVAVQAIARGLGNIETRQGAVEAMPFADGCFDLVASRYSAHHWPDLAAALAEARRVLAKGGRAVFMDIAAPAAALFDSFLQTIEMLRDPSHVRDYGAEEWRKALIGAGFRPAEPVFHPVRLDFAQWISRMAPPTTHVAAIRSLQMMISDGVRRHFNIEADGSFVLTGMLIQASPTE